MDIVEGSIAASASLFSGVAAVAAWRAARQANQNARTANDTAAAAREIAEQVAKIEQDRHHRELTPVLTVTLNRWRGDGRVPLLQVRLDGPQALDHLDEVTIEVRNSRDLSEAPVLGDGRDVEERNATLWGPYRFRAGLPGVADERTATLQGLRMDEVKPLALEETYPPSWYAGTGGVERWREEYAREPFLLWARCRVEGQEPWTLSARLERIRVPRADPRSPGPQVTVGGGY